MLLGGSLLGGRGVCVLGLHVLDKRPRLRKGACGWAVFGAADLVLGSSESWVRLTFAHGPQACGDAGASSVPVIKPERSM